MRLLFYVAIFLSSNFVFSQTSLEQIDLPNRKYKVGFRNYQTDDSTRSYQRIFDWNNRSIPRPISVSIWYPAENVSNLKPLSVLDYMKIFAAEKEWEYLPDEQILNWFPNLTNTAENQKHLQEETIAFRNPTPLIGSFPVVVYAPELELSSIENFALCEYLACHGYVVIASPSRGAENQFMSSVANGMETQARDIEFLIKEVSTYQMADIIKIATVGYSFGGLSNVLA